MTLGEEIKAIKKFLKKLFVPTFDEVSLYVMSSSCLFIYIIDSGFRKELHHYLITTDDLRVFLILSGLLTGIFFSLFHAFSNKYKRKTHKGWMLYFALTLQYIAGMFGLFLSIDNEEIGFFLPFLNWISATITYFLYDQDKITEDQIDNRDAHILEIIFASIIISCVISVMVFITESHWMSILSLSIILGNQVNSFSTKLTSSILNTDY